MILRVLERACECDIPVMTLRRSNATNARTPKLKYWQSISFGSVEKPRRRAPRNSAAAGRLKTKKTKKLSNAGPNYYLSSRYVTCNFCSIGSYRPIDS